MSQHTPAGDPPNTPSTVRQLQPLSSQPTPSTPRNQQARFLIGNMQNTPTDLGSPASTGYYSEQDMTSKTRQPLFVSKSMPSILGGKPSFTLTRLSNGSQTLEAIPDDAASSSLLRSVRITTRPTILFPPEDDDIPAPTVPPKSTQSAMPHLAPTSQTNPPKASAVIPPSCDPIRVAQCLNLPPCPAPAYSPIMLVDRDTYFGLPVNLEDSKAAWQAVYDPDLINLPKLRSLDDDRRSASKSLKRFEHDRKSVHNAMLSLIRPLLVIKRGNKGTLVDGELYVNSELGRELFAEKFKGLKNVFAEVRKRNREGEDGWWRSLSLPTLKDQLCSAGWIVPTSQPPKVREMALDVDYLLGLPGIGEVISEIIEDGVSLIRDMGYQPDDLEPEQLRILAAPLFDMLAEPMVQAGAWTDYTVEQARRPLVKGASWRTGAPLYESAGGRMKPLSQQLPDKVRECAAGALGAVDTATTTITRPVLSNRHHCLAISWGIHDRGANAINPHVEGYFEFYRSLRTIVRRAAPGSIDYTLPPVSEESSNFLSVNWNAAIGEGAARVKDLGTQVVKMVDPLDAQLLKSISPYIKTIRDLVPNLSERLDKACRGFDPTRTGKTNAARLRIYPSSQPGAFQSRFFLLHKEGESWHGRIARVAAEITHAESAQAQLKDTLEQAKETPAMTYQRCKTEFLNTPVPLKALFEGTLAQMKIEMTDTPFQMFADPALKAIEDAYFGLGVIRPGRPDPLPTFDLVSSLIARVLMRVNHHFKTLQTKQVRIDLLNLLFDVVLLNMALPTPGLAGLYAQAEIRRICSFTYRHCPVPLSASLLSRIHVDLIGIETALILLSSEHVRDGIVKAAWNSLSPAGEAPIAHPLYFMRLLEIQHLLCGHPSCEEALIYDPRQFVKKGGKHIKRARTLISVQQTVSRGNVDLSDGAPDFPAFPCLWICSVFPFDRSVTNAISPYVQLIHSDDRKLTGKPHDSSLQGELNEQFIFSMEQLAIAEQLDHSQQYDGDESVAPSDDKSTQIVSTQTLDMNGKAIEATDTPQPRRQRVWRIDSPESDDTLPRDKPIHPQHTQSAAADKAKTFNPKQTPLAAHAVTSSTTPAQPSRMTSDKTNSNKPSTSSGSRMQSSIGSSSKAGQPQPFTPLESKDTPLSPTTKRKSLQLSETLAQDTAREVLKKKKSSRQLPANKK